MFLIWNFPLERGCQRETTYESGLGLADWATVVVQGGVSITPVTFRTERCYCGQKDDVI